MDRESADRGYEILLGRARLRLLGGIAMSALPTTLNRAETPRVIIRLLDNPATPLIARIMVTAPFIVGGLTKLVDWLRRCGNGARWPSAGRGL